MAAALVLLPALQPVQLYAPPRLVRATLPPPPAATIIGGGEVIVEFGVDDRGTVVRPAVVRSTPPYTEQVVAALRQWRFRPAHVSEAGGRQQPVDVRVTLTAIFRPPLLVDGPAAGSPPRDVSQPSPEAAYPLVTAVPKYPPTAVGDSLALYEVGLDEQGRMIGARRIASLPPFDRAARNALAAMRFRGGVYGAAPVPSTTYVLFGFRAPVVSSLR
jgi:TonB family protein